MKKISLLLALIMTVTTLTSCGNGGSSSNKDSKEPEALGFEAVLAQKAQKTVSDSESAVYKYVSDAVTVDTSILVEIDNTETEQAIYSVIDEINTALCTGKSSTVISDDLLNYMLMKFCNTPFGWDMSDVQIRGMDAKTRMYFVDVTYETDPDVYKTILPDSVIVRGSDREEEFKLKRYEDALLWYECIDQGDFAKWQRLVEKEWRRADAIEYLTWGEGSDNNSVTMDGYELDSDEDIAEQEEEDPRAQYYQEAGEGEDPVFLYTFEDRWGSFDELFRTQEGITLMQRVAELNNGTPDIGICTYTGLQQVAANHGATITFRFLLKSAYSFSDVESLRVQSMYLHSYDLHKAVPLDELGFEILDEEPKYLEEYYKTDTVNNSNALIPHIERVIKAYSKAVDESNHIGLNSLFEAYGKYDTYYANFSEYTYATNGGFSVEPIGRKGNEIACIVTQHTKERAKGTYMTMPSYVHRYFVKLKLCEDDTLRIVSTATLSMNLIGEPLSMIRNVTGVSEKISYSEASFTAANQLAVEEALQKFIGKLFDTNGTMGTDIYEIVDMGISKTEKNNLEKYFKTLNDMKLEKAYTWVTGYESKSNVYVQAKLRELYVCEKTNYEVESRVSLAYRNDQWYVVSYVIDFATEKSKNKNTTVKDALIVCDAEKSGDKRCVLYSTVQNATGDKGGFTREESEEGWQDAAYEAPVETTAEGEESSAETEKEQDNPLEGLF